MPLIEIDGKISLEDPRNVSDKVLDEKTTRRKLLQQAKLQGYYVELMQLFAKYDKLMRECTNEKERQDIAKIGIFQIYSLIKGGRLYVDGNLVYSEKSEDKGKW